MAQESRRKYAGIVRDKEITRPKEGRQLANSRMGKRARRALEHEQSRFTPRQRVLSD